MRDLDNFRSISSFRLHALLCVYLLFRDIAETLRFDGDGWYIIWHDIFLDVIECNARIQSTAWFYGVFWSTDFHPTRVTRGVESNGAETTYMVQERMISSDFHWLTYRLLCSALSIIDFVRCFPVVAFLSILQFTPLITPSAYPKASSHVPKSAEFTSKFITSGLFYFSKNKYDWYGR